MVSPFSSGAAVAAELSAVSRERLVATHRARTSAAACGGVYPRGPNTDAEAGGTKLRFLTILHFSYSI